MPDPCDTRVRVKADDPVIEERAELFVALLRTFGVGRWFKVKEIAGEGEPGSLADQVAQLLPGNTWESKSAGQLLRRHTDIPHLGVTLRARQTSTKVRMYRFEGTPESGLKAEIDGE